MNNPISRRDFLAGSTAAAIAGCVESSRAADTLSTQEVLREMEYDEVELTGGPFKEQYDRIHALYLALDNDRLLKVYRARAGMLAPGADMGGWYDADGFVPGHSLGQYISGLARIGRTTSDPACHAKVGELVEGFAGTLGSGDRIFAGSNAEKVWPCYILDKHLVGLIDAHNLSSIPEARELLPRVFRGALPFIPRHGHERVGKKDPPYDETYVLPENMFDAYALTRERPLYDRAVAYLLNREFFDPLAEGKDVLPGRHAYSHVIALSSAGRARLMLGDEQYLRSMSYAWQFLTATQQYASGGWGPNETFIEPHRGQLYESLRSTDDHFETPCGSYAAVKLARYLLRATGDGCYGDGMERVLYNGSLAVKDPDGDGDFPYYSTYSSKAQKVFYPRKWPCCSGTLVQVVADYVKNIYFRSHDGFVVNLYAPSRARFLWNDVSMSLEQKTDYPLGNSVKLHVECAQPVTLALHLRIPDWLEERPPLKLNGIARNFATQRGFVTVRRTWWNGDELSLELPQAFRMEPIDELHEKTVAMLRGPLQYVQMNPGDDSASMPALESLQPENENAGVHSTTTGTQIRVFVPLYFVRNERYTSYFERS